jgi:multiple sugar transport system permease protein
MTSISEAVATPRPLGLRDAVARWLDREAVFSWLMMALPLIFLFALVGYPFVYGVYLSLESRPVAQPGVFVGLRNYIEDARGLALALVINQNFRMKNLIRAALLLPFIVPTVLSTVAWMWILDPAFSVINWVLVHTGIVKAPGPSWLGNPTLAMASIIVINIWRGLPFYAITLLAGLQAIPLDLYEAAAIDGAGGRKQFWHITLPLLMPVILIVTVFSVIFTFADFQLVYVLTHGGPANATQLFATYAFDIAMSGGQLGRGASVALAMLPMLGLLIIFLTINMRKRA